MKSFNTVRRKKRKKIQFLIPLFGGVRFAVIDMNFCALFFSLKPDSILHSGGKKNCSQEGCEIQSCMTTVFADITF